MQQPLQALPERPLPFQAIPRPRRVRARGRGAAANTGRGGDGWEAW